MTWDLATLIIMVIGLAIYIVFMSLWWEEGKLRQRHFYGMWFIVILCLVQAVSV